MAVEKPQQLFWLYKEAIYSFFKVYMPVKQARIWPENIDSGTNGVGKPPFGLKLCVVRAVHLRMPPACLGCQKTPKIRQKTRVLAIFGPRAALGPISPWMRCAAGSYRPIGPYLGSIMGSRLCAATNEMPLDVLWVLRQDCTKESVYATATMTVTSESSQQSKRTLQGREQLNIPLE